MAKTENTERLVLNLGLTQNPQLYEGCEIRTVGGRPVLVTPIEKAIEIIGTNALRWVTSISEEQRDEIVLTGPMAVWAYLVVFHIVVHQFKRVIYKDGKGNEVLIAMH